METPTFKKGDHVRLKAWVQPRRASVLGRLFEHGWVGIVQNSAKYDEGVVVIVQHCHNDENVAGQSFVYESDLELMPERQVHVVKDGKVYELRYSDKDRGVFDCQDCAIRLLDCHKIDRNGSCQGNWRNFQKVISGKLVS